MNIELKLEIFIPTYNRKAQLENTLIQLVAPESPVKNCSITVLDNASDDGSSQVIADFAAKYSNIKHIRHAKNIGGNANITRAYEMAKAEYVWVLCDDDTYDFTHANELVQALQQKPDALLVVKHSRKQLGPGDIFQECSFAPAAIYRTEFITSDTLMNMYCNIVYMFPHLAVTAQVINKGGHIAVLPHPIVIRTPCPAYTRGCSGWVHPMYREMDWILGYFVTMLLLNDVKHQQECILALDVDGDNFYNLCGRFMALPKNKILLYGMGLRLFPAWYKFKFALLAWPSYLCSFYRTEHGLYVRILGKLKTKIWH
ncbi:MAG: glycosyltransferase family 2 protein [Elusimicrobiaceae bacterium]|nr:glycosyltransferase family 2 protein [Elusimicrobiaceae bacterium]